MQRYFIDSEKLEFNKEQIHHIKTVMRMQCGDRLIAVFKEEALVLEINNLEPFEFEIVDKIDGNPELNVDITLLYCLPKGDKLDFVIQKATEIGVKRIVLVQSSRCVSKFKKEDFAKKRIRFNKIALEASEQSHRLAVPEIYDIIDYKDIRNYHFDHAFIAYENEKSYRLDKNFNEIKKGDTIGILIGCEGGFSKEEVDYAYEWKYQPVTLGKRILRSETACVYALSVIANGVEDL